MNARSADLIDAPLELHRAAILPEWIDYNGHLNVAYYVLAFDHSTDALLDYLGFDTPYRESSGCSTFALEVHVTYLRELHAGDPIRFTQQLLDFDYKRFHHFHHMYHGSDGQLAATYECIGMHMDMGARASTPMPDAILERMAAVKQAHDRIPRPTQAGHVIGVRPRGGGN